MIRVMLVDDHAIVREGYKRLLELQSDIVVVAEAGDGGEALVQWRALRPEVAVIDLGLPGMGGIELIARLRQRDADCRMLAFSMHRDAVWVAQALRAGALGYVTKSSAPSQLVGAVREVHRGRRVLSSDVSSEVAHALLDPQDNAVHGLSPREFEVLRLLVGGRTPQEIAQSLSLSVKTVHNVHYQIKSKLGTTTDFELARLAWQKGWIT